RHGGEGIFSETVRADFVGPALCNGSTAHNDLYAWAKTVPLQSLDYVLLPRHRCGQQGRDADEVGVQLFGFEGKRLKRNVDAKIEHFKSIRRKHRSNEGFPDFVNISLHRSQHNLPKRFARRAGLLNLRFQGGGRRLHGFSGEHQVREKHLACFELLAYNIQSGNEAMMNGIKWRNAMGDGLLA